VVGVAPLPRLGPAAVAVVMPAVRGMPPVPAVAAGPQDVQRRLAHGCNN
jgi:hypothetical protein